MTLTLEEAIERVPFLANSNNLKTSPLAGGITNLNYQIDADGKSYVLRITGADTDLLGIRREVEYAANLAAGKLGVAPEVVYFIEPEGYLVTRFVPGRKISPREFNRPEYIRRFARKIRLFHKQGPILASEFNVFRRVEMLTDICTRNDCEFPSDFDLILEKMHEAEEELLKDPHTPTPCHNDLLNLNFLDEEVPGEIGELRLLDWEYAGMGDIFFDLSNFCQHHRLEDEQMRILLEEYFSEVSEKSFARLKIMLPMSELHEAMWGTTQAGISKLEEDFQGYANLWFGRFREHVNDPRWDAWLAAVSKRR